MTAPLICPKCGREIAPGDMVEFVGPDAEKIESGEQRIFTDEDFLVVHATCPTGEDTG